MWKNNRPRNEVNITDWKIYELEILKKKCIIADFSLSLSLSVFLICSIKNYYIPRFSDNNIWNSTAVCDNKLLLKQALNLSKRGK